MTTGLATAAVPERKVHPAAALFPAMNAEEFAGLKEDIRLHGVHEHPLVDHSGAILDGRHRFKACEELGIECVTTEIGPDEDPLSVVMSANLHRRHLTPSQRAMIAAKLANIQHGHNRHADKVDTQNCESTSQADAAALLRVSPRSVSAAKSVIEHGSPKLVEAVEAGKFGASRAASLVSAVPSKAEQTRLLGEGNALIDHEILRLKKPADTTKKQQLRKPAPTRMSVSRKQFAAAMSYANELADLLDRPSLEVSTIHAKEAAKKLQAVIAKMAEE